MREEVRMRFAKMALALVLVFMFVPIFLACFDEDMGIDTSKGKYASVGGVSHMIVYEVGGALSVLLFLWAMGDAPKPQQRFKNRITSLDSSPDNYRNN
jgi:hypothetical protein